jgi:hypothetical protein
MSPILRAILSANMLCSVEPSLSQSCLGLGSPERTTVEKAQAERMVVEENFMVELKI